MANVHAFETTKESPYSDAALSVLLGLRADVAARIGRLETSLAEINNAITERCTRAVTEARSELQKYEGRVRVVVEGVEVVSDVPKRVEWSTERLDEIAGQIQANGLNSTDFIDYKLATSYGQQARLVGQDHKTMGSLIDVLANQVCRINLNTQCQRGPDVFPFTGRKSSAEGTLSVGDALRSFSLRSLVAAPNSSVGKTLVRAILDGDQSNFLNTDIIL